MLCNTISYYPNGIDNMLFFQDNDLEKISIINTYNNLIEQGKYTEAGKYINFQNNVYGFFADYFNIIENRIFNLQKYILEKPPKEQPFIYYNLADDGNEEPSVEEGMFWI